MKRLPVIIVILLWAGIWPVSSQAGGPDSGPLEADGAVNLRGRVVRVDLEGGFWGIVSEDGRHFDPVKLPSGFQQDGLQVEATALILKDVVSIRMWGQPIRILDIRKVPLPEP